MRKIHGVRTQKPLIDFEHTTEIHATLDWNNPATSDSLSAGIYISPDSKSMTPGFGVIHYIRVMYFGGHGDGPKARLQISIGGEGGEHIIYDEGYKAFIDDETGERTFEYRNIGIQQLRIVVNQHELAVWENDKLLCRRNFNTFDDLVAPLTWSDSYLFLQQERSEGYPAHEVFFSKISVRQLPEQPGLQD